MNHWATYDGRLIGWDLAFPPALWDRWDELVRFRDAVIELGAREEVFILDEPLPDLAASIALDLPLFPDDARPTSRISVTTAGGPEDRTVSDLGALLRALRPELDPRRIPPTPALTLHGPLTRDRTGPVYVSIDVATDLWLPRVVGLLEPSDAQRWYDNRALAERHTPRLNRFLAGVRAAAVALGAAWTVDCANERYEALVSEDGVDLDAPAPTAGSVDATRLRAWAEAICRLPPTAGAPETAAALGVSRTLTMSSGVPTVSPPPPGATSLRITVRRDALAHVAIDLAGPHLTRAALDAVFGAGQPLPPSSGGGEYPHAYEVALPGAPASCTVIAYFREPSGPATPAATISLRRDLRA